MQIYKIVHARHISWFIFLYWYYLPTHLLNLQNALKMDVVVHYICDSRPSKGIFRCSLTPDLIERLAPKSRMQPTQSHKMLHHYILPGSLFCVRDQRWIWSVGGNNQHLTLIFISRLRTCQAIYYIILHALGRFRPIFM